MNGGVTRSTRHPIGSSKGAGIRYCYTVIAFSWIYFSLFSKSGCLSRVFTFYHEAAPKLGIEEGGTPSKLQPLLPYGQMKKD